MEEGSLPFPVFDYFAILQRKKLSYGGRPDGNASNS